MTSRATDASTVFIIEDEFAIREALTEFLEEEGYTVVGAAHGREALEYLQTAPQPGLILLDLRMPVMNGVQFLDALRAHPQLASIPVVLMSADSSGQHEVDPNAIVEHLDKPVRLVNVLEIVERYCNAEPSESARR